MSAITASPEIAREVASWLLDTEAVKLSPKKPFRWASGWWSPIYCDNRVTLSFPEVRKQITNRLVEVIKQKYGGGFDSIAGVATAGIAQAALVAEAMHKPMCYVRPKPKDHGRENLIEGMLKPGSKVIVLEDLVSTGGSSIKAAQAIQEAGMDVLGMVSIFRYGFPEADLAFKEAELSLISLSDYTQLLHVGMERGFFAPAQLAMLSQWQQTPSVWNPHA